MLNRPTLNLYVAWHVLKGISLAFVIIASVVMLVDFVELSRNYGGISTVSAGDLVTMTFLKAPGIIEQTLPFMVLFGVMGALFQLNKKSELIVMRAAGLSAWKFLTPALVVTLLIGILGATLFNPLAASMNTRFEAVRADISRVESGSSSELGNEVWLREGNADSRTVIRAESYEKGQWILNDVTFMLFDYDAGGTAEFARRIDASTAQLLPNGFWLLKDVLENAPELSSEMHTDMSLPTRITPDAFAEGTGQFKIPSFWKFPEATREARAAGFSTRSLNIAYHKLLSLPLLLMAMAVVAACVSMRMVRSGGALRIMILGAVVGFAVYFVGNIITAFGENGTLPAILSVWSVPIFVLFSGLGYLSLKEDG